MRISILIKLQQFNILTGLKLGITYLSSVFLSICNTDSILAIFENVEVLIMLLMAIDSGLGKMSDANLTSLVGILSIPGVFLEFRDSRIVLIPLGVVLEPRLENGIEMELDYKFPFLWVDFCICLK